jgi:hypothetical protein
VPQLGMFVVRTFETKLARGPSYAFGFSSPVSCWFQRPRSCQQNTTRLMPSAPNSFPSHVQKKSVEVDGRTVPQSSKHDCHSPLLALRATFDTHGRSCKKSRCSMASMSRARMLSPIDVRLDHSSAHANASSVEDTAIGPGFTAEMSAVIRRTS